MQQEFDIDIRLNEFGKPDVDFYIHKAHQLRSEAIGTGFGAFTAWLKNAIDRAWFPDEQHSHPPRRVVQSDWPWVDLILQSHPKQRAGHV